MLYICSSSFHCSHFRPIDSERGKSTFAAASADACLETKSGSFRWSQGGFQFRAIPAPSPSSSDDDSGGGAAGGFGDDLVRSGGASAGGRSKKRSIASCTSHRASARHFRPTCSSVSADNRQQCH